MPQAKIIGRSTLSTQGSQCSQYLSFAWQVDRRCHLISASSFEKMCADMKQMRDDMSGDLHAHGLVSWCGSSPPSWQNKYSPLCELRLGSAPPLPSIRQGQHEFIGARNGYMPCNQDLGSGDISIGAFDYTALTNAGHDIMHFLFVHSRTFL